MSSIITVEQVRALWNDPIPTARIDRGDDYAPVTKDDLAALASGLETDDDGYPLAVQWDVLAEQLNGETPGEPTSGPSATLLDQIAEARHERDRAKAHADDMFTSVIRAAVASRQVPVTAIAAAAHLSRERIYQIRDGRR